MNALLLAGRLLSLRRQVGKSRLTVAVAVGVTRNTLNNWETGRSYPDYIHLARLCRFYRCTPNDLFDLGDLS